MSEKKMWIQDELTCKPLDTYEEILCFIENPPSWRSLCKEISPHSENMIRNIDINKTLSPALLESPLTFCHFNPETEAVKRQDKKTLPKTLVCHDMANGYHDDSFIDGTGQCDAYTLYSWGGIDVFCYFSHHLVTIPPLGWINVGHAHGVKVIGTVITEWSEGVAFWDNILESEEKWQHFASALVAIAKTLKFDGWLLNIENKISRPAVLLQFVQQLHTVLHQELEAPLLIWYDSVTIDGHLYWQNGLTEKNMKFFEAADGLFTNYSWTVEDVRRSAEAAGARLTDLYVGVDVWGRNMHGGGQFNTQQAIQVAHSFGCSLAIFAPAWTREAMAEGPVDMSSDSEELSSYEQFLLRDRALWTSIWPYLNTKLPCELPLQTSFCRGQGKKRRLYGEVISPAPWFNLRHMQYQPNSSLGPHGYVLSTQDNINKISRSGLFSHRDGIQNYRRVIEESKQDVIKEAGVSQKKTVSITTEVDQKEFNTKHGESHSLKQKVKSTLLAIFKQKSSSSEESGEYSGTNPMEASDSLVQLSVTIRLGDNKEKVRYSLAYVPNELECLEPFYEDSFVGGSCLKVNPRDEVTEEHRFARIFHCDFRCEELIACVATKKLVGYNDQYLNIVLHIDGESQSVVLIGRNVPHGSASDRAVQNVYPTDESDGSFRELQTHLLLNEPGFYVPVQNAFGWKVRYYRVKLGANARVSTISCRTGLDEGPVLLGHLGLCHGSR